MNMATAVSSLSQCFVLRNVSWATYDSLTEDLADCRSPRLTYDGGMLEMMTPSTDHERVNRRLHSLVETILRAWKLKADNVGSNTFKRKDLEKGFEPDTCFYIQNVASVLGKERIDLRSDPPPDLVIEVEVTNAVINKLALYAAVGVPEVWRWDGSSVHFLVLQKGEYAVSTESRVIQGLRSDIVSQFIRDSRTQELTEWLDAVERWARHNRRG